MNKLFQFFRVFVRNYVDDVVVFSKIFEKHVIHFHQIFVLFDNVDISFKSSKKFLKYFIVTLFEQRVNALNLSTNEKKIKIIVVLQFLANFKKLKIYLNFTN